MRKTRKGAFLLLAALMLMISACSNSSGGSGGGSDGSSSSSGNQTDSGNSGTSNTSNLKDVYSITISENIKHGSVAADKETAKKDDYVNLTITPESEYVLTSICVISSDGNKKYLSGRKDFIEIKMPEDDITITATFDLPPNTLLKELSAGTDGTAGKEWTYVLLGDYPQTVKAKDVTVDEERFFIRGYNKYMKGSDGAWYFKCEQQHYLVKDNYTYSDGSEVTREDKGTYNYFKVEPIKWRVLTEDYNGKKLLLAEKVLFPCLFDNWNGETRIIDNKTVYQNNYEYSNVRQLLNKEFLEAAFSVAAKEQICNTLVVNNVESTLLYNYSSDIDYNDNDIPKDGKNDYVCPDTTDKIFALSVKEATNPDYGFYKLSDEFSGWNSSPLSHLNALQRDVTDYYLSQDGNGNLGGTSWYLRSPFFKTGIFPNRGNEGCIYNVDRDSIEGTGVHFKIGVLPALCVE